MNNSQIDLAGRHRGMNPRLRSGLSGFVVISVLGLVGCSQAPPEALTPPPPAVKVSPPLKRLVTNYADFTGRTMAVDSVRLRARVWGHLEKINFTEGADVKKDDVLFVIDQRHYKAALARADAELAQNEARYKRLASERSRSEALSQSPNGITRQELEKIIGDAEEAAAMVKSAIAVRETAKLNLDCTEIRSPINGQIGRALLTVGNMVESGETGGTVLTSIMSTDTMYAYFDVDDQTWVQFRQQLHPSSHGTSNVQLGLSNEKGYPHLGTLDFMDNQVDSSTGTLRMRGLFQNQDRALVPGLFARIRVSLGSTHDALLVSDRAVDTDQGQKILYVVNRDNVVEKRLATLGGLHDGLREIESGVKDGEMIVIEGIQRVRAGTTVAPETIESSYK